MDIDDIVLRVYRAQLDAYYPGDADRMVRKDGDNGEKQRRRAEFVRSTVVETLVQAGVYERPKRIVPTRKKAVRA